MTAKFGYVTTACRLCEDIVPPDGGDLRCGAVDGSIGSPLQPVLAHVRERVPKRHCYGPLRWKRPTESHSQHTRLKSGPAHPLAHTRHVPVLQPLSLDRQAIDAISSRKTTELFIQRRICKRLQPLPPGEERRPIHRIQQERWPDETFEEPNPPATAKVFFIFENSSRIQYRKPQ
ncbi:jg5823 [Pararge aegeria aegeria]|uniref:Jg5823 protein n=1 Tax=Pararge aegeria aegeria TaxID=348720 RepID=A0A8S4RE78_9NEOP|nr:jg5823 [Pararge aegeria aegeria]